MNSHNNRIVRARTLRFLDVEKERKENTRVAREIRHLAHALPRGCKDTKALFFRAARSLETR